MPRALFRFVAPASLALLLVACGTGSSTEPRELSLAITPEHSTVTVGEPVALDIVAEGTGLVSLVLFWGDGTVVDVSLPNISRSTRREEYVYETPGTYEPMVRIMERTGLTLEESVTVEVVEP